MMENLIRRYDDGAILLFAENGVSLNLGLQNWEHIIDMIADDLGFDPKEYKQLGDYLILAEYYLLKQGTISRLRSWMERAFHNIPSQSLEKSKINEYIAKGNFSTIYTTNYDNWIENAHELYGVSYNKIVNMADLSAKSSNVGKYKVSLLFLGRPIKCTDREQYFHRLQFDNPLDIKLQADILGISVLFVGYSL